MSRYRGSSSSCKLYIGELALDATERDVERAFDYYGPVRSVWVARNPPGFAFVEFEESRDADDALRGLDGSRICGKRIRVEASTGRSGRPKQWMRVGPPPSLRRSFHPEDRCYQCGERGHYAYDCHRYNRKSDHSRRSRRSRTRSRSRSRSRSYDRHDSHRHHSRSRSYSRSRSRSHDKHSRSKSRSRTRSRSKGKEDH